MKPFDVGRPFDLPDQRPCARAVFRQARGSSEQPQGRHAALPPEHAGGILYLDFALRADDDLGHVAVKADQFNEVVVVIGEGDFPLPALDGRGPVDDCLLMVVLGRRAKLLQPVMHRFVEPVTRLVFDPEPHVLDVKPVVFFDLAGKLAKAA